MTTLYPNEDHTRVGLDAHGDLRSGRLEMMRAAVEATEDYGTYVGAHSFVDRAIKRLIAAGGRSIEHGFLMSEEVEELIAENGVYVSPPMSWTKRRRACSTSRRSRCRRSASSRWGPRARVCCRWSS